MKKMGSITKAFVMINPRSVDGQTVTQLEDRISFSTSPVITSISQIGRGRVESESESEGEGEREGEGEG